MPITLTISHLSADHVHVTGFNQLWARYVTGFNPATHCQRCLRGQSSARVSKASMPLGVPLVFDERASFNQLYICGLAAGPKPMRRARNLHLPLIECAGSEVVVETYNGYRFAVQGAKRLAIPEASPDLAHLGVDHYRCCNFRFGVEYYGYTQPPRV